MFINITYDQPDNVLPAGSRAPSTKSSFFDTTFTSVATINTDVGLNEVHGQPIHPQFGGESFYFLDPAATYAQLRAALIAQDAPGSASLPLTGSYGPRIKDGKGRREGFGLSKRQHYDIDDWVGFTSTAAGQAISSGLLAHEISEAMGRTTLLDLGGNLRSFG